YSFDSKSQQCQPLLFLGCGGNSNNFATTELCYNFCLGAVCAVSETVFISQSTGLVHDCARTPCPAGYSCVPDSRNASRMVCCGTPHRGTCPFGSRLVRLRTGDPFGCNHDSHCPERATCHKSNLFAVDGDGPIPTPLYALRKQLKIVAEYSARLKSSAHRLTIASDGTLSDTASVAHIRLNKVNTWKTPLR
ncbi:Kunitz/Bovine pancreatic trypsin inhibitor domain protein, partial [Ostertagia ostertagi]